MGAIIARLKAEPALIVGALASGIVAAVLYLAGHDVLGSDIVATVQNALDPAQGGWLIPLITGFVTRFFVSPAR